MHTFRIQYLYAIFIHSLEFEFSRSLSLDLFEPSSCLQISSVGFDQQ